MPLYGFRCREGHTTEARRGYDALVIPCPLCGADARRLAVHRVHIGGGETTKFRLTEYQEAAAEANYYHGRMEESAGRELPRRDLVAEAKAKARKMGAVVK